MKVMNISGSAIYLNTHDREGAPVGLNRFLSVNMELSAFQNKNPDYILNTHYVVLSEEFHANEIMSDPIEMPVEITDNAPRLIFEPQTVPLVDGPVIVEMLEAMTETIEEQEIGSIDTDSPAVDETEDDVRRTQIEWEDFFSKNTKTSLKEFAELRGIEFPQNANKNGIVTILTNWLRTNNLITEKENE